MSPHGDSCDLPGERALGHRYGRIGAAIAVGGLLASMLGAGPAAAADPPTDVVLDAVATVHQADPDEGPTGRRSPRRAPTPRRARRGPRAVRRSFRSSSCSFAPLRPPSLSGGSRRRRPVGGAVRTDPPAPGAAQPASSSGYRLLTKLRRTVRVGLSRFGSTSAIDCHVPRPSSPPT